MATGLDPLRNDRIRAVVLKPARLCDRRRGAEDLAARGLETVDKGFVGKPEMETNDFWL